MRMKTLIFVLMVLFLFGCSHRFQTVIPIDDGGAASSSASGVFESKTSYIKPVDGIANRLNLTNDWGLGDLITSAITFDQNTTIIPQLGMIVIHAPYGIAVQDHSGYGSVNLWVYGGYGVIQGANNEINMTDQTIGKLKRVHTQYVTADSVTVNKKDVCLNDSTNCAKTFQVSNNKVIQSSPVKNVSLSGTLVLNRTKCIFIGTNFSICVNSSGCVNMKNYRGSSWQMIGMGCP
jgi:hypothetical protein